MSGAWLLGPDVGARSARAGPRQRYMHGQRALLFTASQEYENAAYEYRTLAPFTLSREYDYIGQCDARIGVGELYTSHPTASLCRIKPPTLSKKDAIASRSTLIHYNVQVGYNIAVGPGNMFSDEYNAMRS
ncbi:hypothetical protein PMIN06_005732 [Paraphaeosphaeria minitans]|uniref:Uncharacterized protein n=1 Tax=Paraphaeosphaeria minitans TaxID=565426 RepID=A0A9P6GEI5_9PLEO|nr:hypothetical protein PMIN01_08542 [Paraphaeosphaeria minitans]